MSEKNVTVIREAFAAFTRGDLEWFREHADPDVEITQPPEQPDGRTFRGFDGYMEVLRSWPAEWDDWQIQLGDVLDVSETQVVSVMHQQLRTRGLEIEQDVISLFTFEGGRIKRWDMFLSLDQALAAAKQR